MSTPITKNVALTPDLAEFVSRIADSGEFTSTSEYFRQLLREDRERRLSREIDEQLLAGLNSGEPVEVSWDQWQEKKRRLIAEALSAQKSGGA